MSRDDNDKRLKDNAGRDLKPKAASRGDHAPTGSVGLTPNAPGTSPPGKTFAKDRLAQAAPDRGRDQRDFSRNHQLGKVMRGDSGNQNVLGGQFRDAKSRSDDAPAEKPRDDPSRGRDR